MQRKKLRSIVKHAYEHVSFYHRKFDDAGIKPDDVKSVDDLSKVPVTTRSELQNNPIEDLVSRNVNVNKCVKTMTSGSTGMPLTVISDAAWNDFAGAVWTRALLENGLRLQDKMVIIKNPLFFPKRKGLLKLLRRKHISVFDDIERQLDLLEDYKPDVIKGYPITLAMLARVCRDRGLHINPRLIFTGSELLNKQHRKLISTTFQCELLDYYGCIEFGLLMWECCEHKGYHMNVDGVVTEFLDNEEVVGPGERGEIVCTGLQNFVMPLIRYRLGDIGIPLEDQCPCNRSLPLMKMLKGRTDDVMVTLDGRIIYASSFFYNLFENLGGIRQFRVIQERRDTITIQLVVREILLGDSTILENAKSRIQAVFGEGINIDFQILEKIDRDSTGKLRQIISHVPVRLTSLNE